MSTFESITFEYQGESITVPGNLRLISVLERNYDVLELAKCKFQNAATIAMFLSPVFTYVGFKDVDENVLARQFAKAPEAAAKLAMECLDLMNSINPPKDVSSELAPVLGGEAADTPNDPAKKPQDPS